MLVNSSLYMPLLGGVLIGLGAALLWLWSGRVAGISGIVGRIAQAQGEDRSWRLLFLLGLIGGGALMSRLMPTAFEESSAGSGTLVIAGLLVGVGTSVGNGCTSGHGVCGVSRLSPRSWVATAAFIAVGMIAVYAVRHLTGATP